MTSLHFENAGLKRSISVCLWYPKALDGNYPVLLFFPGWGGDIKDNSVLLRGLSEHGFIVVGVSYPEGSDLPDRKIPMSFVTDSGYLSGTKQGDTMVHIQAEDASFVLDQLLALDQHDSKIPIARHLDSKKVGVLGYSLGGAVAAQVSLDEPRVLATMNLDGWMFGDPVTKKFAQPYLVISDGLAQPTSEQLSASDPFTRNFSSLRTSDHRVQTTQLSHSGGYRITIAGSDHFTFSDSAKFKAGLIDPSRATKIIIAYAADFFGKYLLSKPAPLLDGSLSRFSEAHLETFQR